MKFIFMAKFLQRVYNLDKYSELENDMTPGTEGGGGRWGLALSRWNLPDNGSQLPTVLPFILIWRRLISFSVPS